MSKPNEPFKPVFKSTEPDSFDINIADKSGLRTLMLSLLGIFGLILTIYILTRLILNFSPYFVSVSLENKIFKSTHTYVFPEANYSKSLTEFAKKLDPENTAVEVFVLPMKDLNAFCFLGNKLFVSSELLKTATTENELAFVLAHELGHAKLRHNLKNLSINLVIGLFFSFVDFLQPASQFLSTGYSRSMESDADDFALKTLQTIYGHTLGAELFFKRVQKLRPEFSKKFEAFSGNYLSTHPNTEQRLAKILKTQDNSKTFKVIKREDSKYL